MTIPQQTPLPSPVAGAGHPVRRPGRSLASAVAVFLGGYLLLASFASQLGIVSWSLFAGLVGRGSAEVPPDTALLVVLQFLFAIGVVAAGLLLGDGPTVGRVLGVVVVAVGSLLTFAFVGLWISGAVPFPSGRDGIPFRAVFANTWFAVVLVVGVAWLLTRRARLGWLSLLGTLILIPVPIALQFAGAQGYAINLVMFVLSGLVGAAIILAGRPLRD